MFSRRNFEVFAHEKIIVGVEVAGAAAAATAALIGLSAAPMAQIQPGIHALVFILTPVNS
jgi:hypothetical protein